MSWQALYQEEPDSIPTPISDVLEHYSGIPQHDQKQHILDIRNQAYRIRAYPCLGRFRFLSLDLSKHPLYNEYVLPKLKDTALDNEPVFLDFGTCLGQDLRKLIHDGVSPSKLYGADIQPAFIDAGYALFQDESKLSRDHFIYPADVFDVSESNQLKKLDHTVDILHITAVFHLFDLAQQAPVAERCLRLLRKTPGTKALVLGCQVGNIDAQDAVRPDGAKRYRHNEESWKALWEDVRGRPEFRNTVKNVDVKAIMKERPAQQIQSGQQQEHIGSPEEGFRWMVWQVWVSF